MTYVLLFLLFLLLHMFIFRGILSSVPEILQGNTVVVREELVPFFDFANQFWPTDTSKLTSSEEVRVLYSFWTSWMRHYAILPFALVLLNTISAFILFYAFYRIGRLFAGKRRLAVLLAAALAAFLIHFVLLYAKVTHFYTLVFGFSLFALSLSLVLEQLFFRRDLSKLNIILLSLLALLNPGVHYHVIFYFTFAFLAVVHIGFTLLLNRAHAAFYLKRTVLYFGIVTLASLVPYVAFIAFVGGEQAATAAQNIPVNYWTIYYWSVPTVSLFALDTAAQIDMFRYGSYIIPLPRVFGMAAMFLASWVFIAGQWKALHIAKRIFLISLFITLLVSAWMAMGYSSGNSFSFHRLAGGLALYLTEQGFGLAQAAGQAIATFVNILRFPHRFQFIFFYAIGVLMMIGLLWLYERIRQRRGNILAIPAVLLIAFSPVLVAKDYFLVLTTGNFATFLQPYRISPDLKRIKTTLAANPGGKLFVMPSLESGRDLIGNGQRYGFIDKFFIYYLNQPTLYYGTDVKPEHKAVAYAVYRAIEDDQPWWDSVLARSLGVTRILQPKQTKERPVGYSYMRGVDANVDAALGRSTVFTKTYDGSDFALYETQEQPPNGEHTLLDMPWEKLAQQLSAKLPNGSLYFPLQLQPFTAAEGSKYLVTDNVERSFYNLYVASQPGRTFYPSTVQLAFSKDLVASSNFTNNTLSMSMLNDPKHKYNYLGERLPSLLGTLTSQFIGVKAGNTGITARISTPANGQYRLLVHAASRAETLIGAVNNRGTIFKKVEGDLAPGQDYIDMSYFYADIRLPAGSHTVVLHNPDNALAVESLTTAPAADMPNNFTDTVEGAGIQLQPAEETGTYTVGLRR